MILRERSVFHTVILLVLLLTGCASSLSRINNSPQCTTTIEGFLHSGLRAWLGPRPCIIVRDFGKHDFWFGEILEVRDDGVVFDQNRISALSDPKPEFIRYKDTIAVIDEHGGVLHGKVPKDYSRTFALELELSCVSDVDVDPVKLKLEQNEPFGFCIEPGIYQVTNIRFDGENDYEDEAVAFPTLRIDIHDSVSNYIGDIYLNCKDVTGCELMLPVDVKGINRPDDDAGIMIANSIGGWFGGLIGGSAELYRDETVPPPYLRHQIAVKHDPQFVCRGQNRKVDSAFLQINYDG
jgi:hypothetical protein